MKNNFCLSDLLNFTIFKIVINETFADRSLEIPFLDRPDISDVRHRTDDIIKKEIQVTFQWILRLTGK